MIIFESLLNTFEASFIFEASGAVVKPMRSYKEYVARVRTPKIKTNNNVQTYKMNYKSVEVQ